LVSPPDRKANTEGLKNRWLKKIAGNVLKEVTGPYRTA
jgi:hypothetical protein